MPIISGGTIMPGDGFTSPPFTKAGAPAPNDFAGQCIVGSLCVNTSSGTLYICTASNGSTTSAWAMVATQVGP